MGQEREGRRVEEQVCVEVCWGPRGVEGGYGQGALNIGMIVKE